MPDQFELFVIRQQSEVVACIGLDWQTDTVEIGHFAVSPQLQNQGISRKLLQFAETHIVKKHAVKSIIMSVLSVRPELIAYYQRRGYQVTTRTAPYPVAAQVGQPLLDLHLQILEKQL